MRIYCEKCHEDITVLVNKKLDGYEVGQVTCPKCQKVQLRYISESDILLHLGISEVLYFVFSLIIIAVFGYSKSIIIAVLLILLLLAIGLILLRFLSAKMYNIGHLKKDYKNEKFVEDKATIIKSNNWQFMLFMMVSIMFNTATDGRLIFYLFSIGCIILTFTKYFLCIRKEKKSIK